MKLSELRKKLSVPRESKPEPNPEPSSAAKFDININGKNEFLFRGMKSPGLVKPGPRSIPDSDMVLTISSATGISPEEIRRQIDLLVEDGARKLPSDLVFEIAKGMKK